MMTEATASLGPTGGFFRLVIPLRSTLAGWLGPAARVERLLVIPCAVGLLTYPNPLALWGLAVGSLPLLLRWIIVGRPWPKAPFDLPLILLLIGALLGAWAGPSAEGAGLRLSGLWAGVILYAALLTHVSTAGHLRLVTMTSLAVSVLACLILVDIVRPYLHVERVPGLAEVAAVIDPWGFTQGLSEDKGLLRRYRFRPSGVGAMACIGLSLAFAAAVGVRHWRGRLLIAPLALLFGCILLVSESRASMVAGAATLAVLATLHRRRLLAIAPIAAVLLLTVLALRVVPKGLSLNTLQTRLGYWDTSLYLAREFPFTGVGLSDGAVQTVYRAYFLPIDVTLSHAHNVYLQILLEQGIFGLLGLIGLTVAAGAAGLRLHGASSRWVRAGGLAGLGAALALFANGLFEIVAVSTIGSALLLAALGLLGAALNVQARTAAASPDARPSAFRPVRRTLAEARWRLSILPAWQRVAAIATATLGIAIAMAITGLGTRLATTALINASAVELNRGLISEDTAKTDRPEHLRRAMALLRAAGRLDPTSATVQRNLAVALAAVDEHQRARAAADRASQLTDPADRRGQFQLGRAYLATDERGKAIRAWERANAAPQLVELGDRLMRKQNWDRAIVAFRSAAVAESDHSPAYAGIVRAARARGDSTERVLAELQPLTGRGGEHAYFAHREAARVYRQDGRLADALGAIDRAAAIRRDATVDGENAVLLVELARYGEALPLLRRAIAAEPTVVDLYYWLGLAELRLGRYEAAMDTLRIGLSRMHPGVPGQRAPFLLLLGDSLLAFGHTASALGAYEEGLREDADDAQLRERVLLTRSAVQFSTSQFTAR